MSVEDLYTSFIVFLRSAYLNSTQWWLSLLLFCDTVLTPTGPFTHTLGAKYNLLKFTLLSIIINNRLPKGLTMLTNEYYFSCKMELLNCFKCMAIILQMFCVWGGHIHV